MGGPRLQFLLVFLAIAATGCPQQEPVPDVAGPDREAEAAGLLKSASVSTVPYKLQYYDKILAYYPETEAARLAHRDKVFYLLDPSAYRPAEAFEAARIFAARHPLDLEVSECFRWLDNRAGEDARIEDRARIQEEWAAFLDAHKDARKDASASERARILAERGDVEMRRRRPEKAVSLLQEAAALPVDAQDLTLKVLFQCAMIQKRDLGDAAAARETFAQALRLSEAGVLGPTPEAIRTEMEGL